MDYSIGIDTLHINLKYPRCNVFDRWYRVARGWDMRTLRAGIPAGPFVVRNGANGYKVSVWGKGIKAYLTDDVDERRGEGRGMGIWIQIDPKFLIANPLVRPLRDAVANFIKELGVREKYPIHVTRIDVAMDIFGNDLSQHDLELWRRGWVGRSRIKSTYYSDDSSDLETINVGSRKSAIYLRVYDKVAEARKGGDLGYWRDVWGSYDGPVTRVEWEVKPKRGGFKELVDFYELDELKIVMLLNYLVVWGRLCIPNPGDKNNRRWKSSPFWLMVQEAARDWSDGVNWPISRVGYEFGGISEAYAKLLAGFIAGGMARFNPEKPNLDDVLVGLEEFDFGIDQIQMNAEKKAEIIKRL